MGVFSERLKTAMQQANITSAQLSKQTGIGRSSISQWLSDKYVAKHDKVTVLATVLGVSPEWLLGTTEAMAVSTPADEAVIEEQSSSIEPELLTLWEQLNSKQRTKLIKKGYKLLAKSESKPKKKKRKQRK
ncbi:helix-turn-helix domain-containing protein [Lactiplantibacillus herbarum]|uniref:helix-turn-helix domain-containing protein n=1 Tax=Lactiplantibacillus herbarum TaxID=1670446 RepID=UPI00064E8CC2|nr:helix-turn-helix domain-containing protein [Lactiplantibacillus herbarum]